MQMAVTLQNYSEVFKFPVFSLCFAKIVKFPVFSLSGITFHNFPCFPCAVGTLLDNEAPPLQDTTPDNMINIAYQSISSSPSPKRQAQIKPSGLQSGS